jgi:exonuclease SbcD
MRFVHIADTHLGLAAFNKLDPESGINLREKLIYDNFSASIEEIIALKPDALVHAGDLFDRVKPKTRAYTTVLGVMDRLKEEGIPFVVISGNHSMPKTRYTTSPFAVLEFHSGQFHAAYRYRYKRVELGDVMFHLIPNMLNVADYRTAYDEIRWSATHQNVLVTHGLASTLHDRRLMTVAEHELDTTLLSADFDYIALGHFHDQRQIADNAWYSGSLEFCTYGEIHDTKGGLMVDTGSHEVRHIDLAHTPMVDLGAISCEDLSASRITATILDAIRRVPPSPQPAMCCLKLTEISREMARGLDRTAITDAKKGLLDLKLAIVHREEDTPIFGGKDIGTLDYLSEFETFVTAQHLDPRVHAFVTERGRSILSAVIERHKEETYDSQ